MLVDTNVVSEMRKIGFGRADARFVAWATATSITALSISAISVMELEKGALLMERRDKRQGDALRRWLNDEVLEAFRNRILPFDDRAAIRCAALHNPNPKPELDAMIAATAFVHGMSVITRNQRDFAGMGVAVFNPWEFSGTA